MRDRGLPEFDVAVIGELNVDLLFYGENVVPTFGQVEKLVEDAVLAAGSSSAIFAHQAARLGLQVAFVGKVGEDPFGNFMLDSLRKARIDTSAVVVDPTVKTGVTLHLVRGEDRAMLTHPGSIAALYLEEVDEKILGRARHLHVGSYFLQKGIQEGLPGIFGRARKAGVGTSLDSGWDPEERWNSGLLDALTQTDVFMPNEQELLTISGKSSLEEALESCVGPRTVVVKRGSSGATAHEDGLAVTCAPPMVDTVDATGAGDSFDAGFLFGLLQEFDLEQALEIGCLCGALSTERSGGIEAQPDLERLKPLLSNSKEKP